MSRGRVAVVRFQPSDENDLLRESKALLAAGFDVEVVCVGRDGEEPTEIRRGLTAETGDAVTLTVRRVRVDKQRGSALGYVRQYAVWMAGVAWLLARHGLVRPYDAVQVSTLPDHQVLATLPVRLRGTRVVVFFKEPAAELFETLFGGAVGRAVALTTGLAWRLADHCLCVTEAHRRRYLEAGVPPERIEVIGNATEPGRWPEVPPEPIPSREFVAVCHGTMEERWGHEVILRAAALAADRVPGLRVVFTGSGGFAERVDELTRELGLEDRVENRGWVSEADLSALLRRADVGLVAQLPSPYSQLVHTGKMYDFFLLGVPVIASDLEATRADFDGCCRFYRADDPADLADALAELADSPETRWTLVSRAARRLERLGWPALRDRYVAAVTGRTR